MEDKKVEYSNIEIIIDYEIRAVLDDRVILDDNLREVIYHGETTNKKIINSKKVI